MADADGEKEMIRMYEDLGASATFDCGSCGARFLFEDLKDFSAERLDDPRFCPCCGAHCDAKLSAVEIWQSEDTGTIN